MQGQAVSMESVIAEYKEMVSDLNHELIMLKAYVKRIEAEKESLKEELERNV